MVKSFIACELPIELYIYRKIIYIYTQLWGPKARCVHIYFDNKRQEVTI